MTHADRAFASAQRSYDAAEPDYQTDAEELDEAALTAFFDHFRLSSYDSDRVRRIVAISKFSDRY